MFSLLMSFQARVSQWRGSTTRISFFPYRTFPLQLSRHAAAGDYGDEQYGQNPITVLTDDHCSRQAGACRMKLTQGQGLQSTVHA
jgi:hypothetical protein